MAMLNSPSFTTGTFQTTIFNTSWTTAVTCVRPSNTNCTTRPNIYTLQLGTQGNPFASNSLPQALNYDAWLAIEYDYTPGTPAPLPMAGAAMAFGWARQLSRLICRLPCSSWF